MSLFKNVSIVRHLSCGGCGSCNLPDGVPAAEYFADYIDGKVEFVKLAAKIWE